MACRAGAHEDNARIVAAGALPPVVALLGTRGMTAVHAAARALCNLAVNADNRVRIAAAGAFSPLVALLGAQSTAEEQAMAASGGPAETCCRCRQQGEGCRRRCNPPPGGTVGCSKYGDGAGAGSDGTVEPFHQYR